MAARAKRQVGGLVVSGGMFAAAKALASTPGLELTAEWWDFIYWAIGALLVASPTGGGHGANT